MLVKLKKNLAGPFGNGHAGQIIDVTPALAVILVQDRAAEYAQHVGTCPPEAPPKDVAENAMAKPATETSTAKPQVEPDKKVDPDKPAKDNKSPKLSKKNKG